MKAAINPKGSVNIKVADLMNHNTEAWITVAVLTKIAHDLEDQVAVLTIALDLLNKEFPETSSNICPINAGGIGKPRFQRVLEEAERIYGQK